MLNIKQKLAAAMTTATILSTVLAPTAFADVESEITNNGANSTNEINVIVNTSTNITQKNSTNVELNVVSIANTGGNTANGTTGGNVTIDTGSAKSKVSITVNGGSNEATVEPCGCNQTVNSTIKNNGEGSNNTVDTIKNHSQNVRQKSRTRLAADVWSKAKTGKNKANGTTGGDVNITTDDAKSKVNVTVNGSSNTLNP